VRQLRIAQAVDWFWRCYIAMQYKRLKADIPEFDLVDQISELIVLLCGVRPSVMQSDGYQL
jgi:hypothetical protein